LLEVKKHIKKQVKHFKVLMRKKSKEIKIDIMFIKKGEPDKVKLQKDAKISTRMFMID